MKDTLRAVLRSTPYIASAAAVCLIATDAIAGGGGTLLEQSANNATDIGVGLGTAGAIASGVGVGAGVIMRSGGILAASGAGVAGSAIWIGSPQLVQQVVGGAAGAGLDSLTTAADILPVMLSILSSLVS